MERLVERVLLACRWLLAPLYLGLALLLLLFVLAFFTELAQVVLAIVEGEHPQLTLVALKLLDLVLVAGLIVMVMLSGFEGFVAKINLHETQERLSWLTELDPSAIKVKIVGSIAVISAIFLLERFFEIDQAPTDKLFWLVVIHLTFVITAVLLALLDRLNEH